MAFLVAESLKKSFGLFTALDDVGLAIEAGEFVTLLGPSGCGKSTFLRIVAGLEKPTQGKLYLEGQYINDVPSYRRNIGLVVQNYALFPHMTVFENVAYGLRVRRVDNAETRKRVLAALDLVRLSGLEKRFPRQLSGGQQQRAALARALVIQPRLILLDEALGALDKNLREDMQVELKQLQRTLGVTTIHVTHDQDEALGMSDRIVVLNHGKIEQFGTPVELYETPQTEFVASFIGDANIFKAQVVHTLSDGVLVARSAEGCELHLSPDHQDSLAHDQSIIVVVRPEYVTVHDQPPDQTYNVFAGTIDTVIYRGKGAKVMVRLPNDRQVTVHESNLVNAHPISPRRVGAPVWVSWLPAAARVVKKS